MRPSVSPISVSDVKLFPQPTLECIEQSTGAFSGVSKDGSICWVVSGPHLEVLQVSTSTCVAAWKFGQVLGDQHTSITCVKELSVGQSLKLLVAISNSSPTGLVCVFDVALCKVTKAVEIPQPVTELEIVCTCQRDSVPRWALSEHLRHFCGIVAVGTSTGHVYLMDLCLDDKEFFSDEEVSSRVHMIWPRHRDIENQRFHCMSQGLHLCVPLNDTLFTDMGFEYQKPDGVVMKTFRPDLVSVTCLTYAPQAGILMVGYSFGCYQIWKLTIPVLEYSSRLESDPMPVTHISYQEPENDPKNFCYIWVARGALLSEESGNTDTLSTITLYQLTFNQRTYYCNYGVFYEDLASVCMRLDHELTSSLVPTTSNSDGSSRVLVCRTLSDPNYQPPAKLKDDDSFEEGNHGPDLSLCLFVWETTRSSRMVSRHLAIFDINRWYHAQMPSSIRCVSGSMETCAYMGFFDVTENTDADSLLTAHLKVERLRKFISNSAMPPEQHFYPSSLAFDVTFVWDCGLQDATYLGTQRQVLATLKKTGPSLLVQPHDVYSLCFRTGLLPRPTDAAAINPSIVVQREAILSMLLEYNMIDIIKACIAQWAGGEYEQHGCTLKFLLDWAWDKVSTIKHQIDTTTVNLYNWSGLALDQRAMQTLLQCKRKLCHLSTVLKVLATQAGPVTDQGQEELQSRMLVTTLLLQHFDAVLWFVGAGLLPEYDDTEDMDGPFFCYPVTNLISAYKTRRTQLCNIHSEMSDTDLLMIDGLVEHIGVQDLWDREGGNGQHPPPSIHALLSSYLLEKADVLSKHCLVLYLLLDLVSLENNEDTMSTKVSGFARRFQIPPTLVKLIQAFWLLDHQDFQEAMVLLLDPMVTVEFSRWQHKRIIKSLLYQGDSKSALRYLTSVNPTLTTPDEVKLKLTVLLANGMTSEALEYQRKCRDETNMRDLLAHLYLGCQQTHTIERLLQLPLTTEEESVLVQYLQESPEPGAQEVLVMHYLQRARFVEAIQLNEKLKQALMADPSSQARERAVARNAIIDRYSAILPTIQRKLLYEQIHIPKKNIQLRREIQRPTPLSTRVTKSRARVMSQSTFVLSIMEKLDEIDPLNQTMNETMNKSVGPFICTPVTPVRKSFRSTPATVYPGSHSKMDEGQSGQFSLRKSLAMFQPSETPPASNKRHSKFHSISCVSLLQTPTVARVTPRSKRPSVTNVFTPQSILKVRSTISAVSPSPQSGSATPDSQELEISQRRVPRKLGYGSAVTTKPMTTTPLSSVPRHLKADSMPGSVPSSPKSVSFAEPPLTPESPGPAPVLAQADPLSSKPVPFTKAALAGTPASEKSGWWSAKAPSVPESPRALKDRSPTPESSQHSPKFIGKMDELLRQPLRSAPSTQTPQPSTTMEEKQPLTSEGVVLSQTSQEEPLEISDEEISDEDIEEMEVEKESPLPTASSCTGDAETDETPSVEPPHLQQSQSAPPPSSSESSPIKAQSSPTVKVSKSDMSEFSAASLEPVREATESVDTEAVPKLVSDHEQTAVDVDSAQDVEEMETGGDGVTSSQQAEIEDEEPVVSTSKEIFKDFEEISPPSQMVDDDVGVVSSSDGEREEVELDSGGQSVKVEVTEENNQLTGQEVVQQIDGPSTKGEEEYLPELPQLKRKSLTPPSERHPLKLKDSPPDTGYEQASITRTAGHESTPTLPQTQTQSVKEMDDSFWDSPVVEEERKFQPLSVTNEEMVGKSRFGFTRRKFDIPVVAVKEEQQHDGKSEMVATNSSSVAVEEGKGEPDIVMPDSPVKEEITVAPVTPRRSARRLQDHKEEASSSEQEESVTPSRSSRRLRSADVGEHVTTTPKPAQKRGKTARSPARSSKEKLVEGESISVPSVLSFSDKAKALVNESLQQLTADLKTHRESVTEMTKLKQRKSVSPRKENKPSGSRRMSKSPASSPAPAASDFTPTRASARLAAKSGHEQDESMSVTPSRRNLRKGVVSSPRAQRQTPQRGKSKDKSENRSPAKSNRMQGDTSNNAGETIDDDKSQNRVQFDRLIKDSGVINSDNSFEHTEIPEEYIEDVSTGVATRRQTVAHSGKTGNDAFGKARTPRRRLSLAHSSKLLKHEKDDMKESDKSVSEILTPTRAGLRSRNKDRESDSVMDTDTGSSVGRGHRKQHIDITTVQEESLLGQRKQTEEVFEMDTVVAEKKLTPSRRGRSRKTDQCLVNTISESEVLQTPTKKGKGVKDEQSEDDKVLTDVVVTPSRRTRRNTAAVDAQDVTKAEIELGSLMPSRGRRRNTTQVSAAEVAAAELDTSVRRTPGRRRNTAQVSASEVAEAELEVSVRRTPGRRRNTTQVSANEVAEASEIIEVSRTPTRGRRRNTNVSSADVNEAKQVHGDNAEKEAQEELQVPSDERATRASPSRSKRAKVSEGSPSRHTRSHDHPHVEMELASGAPEVFEIHSTSFQFSDPTDVQMETDVVTPRKAVTASKSFIFSPPISHSRSDTTGGTVKAETEHTSILLPRQPAPAEASGAGKTGKKSTKRRMKKLYDTDNESILLVSPLSVQSDGEGSNNPFTHNTRAAAKRATTRKDGTKVLLSSLHRRKTRTSHRIGPLGTTKAKK